jgi:hypothetical protein
VNGGWESVTGEQPFVIFCINRWRAAHPTL